MSRTRTVAATLAAVAVGAGGFAAVSAGHDDGVPDQNQAASGKLAQVDSGSLRVMSRAKKGGVTFTHLITQNPQPMAGPNNATFTPLKCSKQFGDAVWGGTISNAPGVAHATSSRFNPNNFSTPKRTFFVGVRNDTASTVPFFGTLVCAKGAKVK